jgi:hypothetical protein
LAANVRADGAAQLAGRFHGPNGTKPYPNSLFLWQTNRVKTHFQRLSPAFRVNLQCDGAAELAGQFHGPNTTKIDPTSLFIWQTDQVKTHFR